MSDQDAVRAIALVCAGFACLLLVLYGYLLLRKWALNRRRGFMAAWTSRASLPESPIERFVTQGENSRRLMPRRKWEWRTLEMYLTHRLRVGGTLAEQERIYRLAGDVYGPLYRNQLLDRRTRIRQHALAHIALFHMDRLQPEVSAFLHRSRLQPEEWWGALRALAAFQDKLAAEWLLGRHGKLPLSSEHRYRQVLMALGTELLEELIEQFDEADKALQRNLIDVLRTRNIRTERCLALYERLLLSPSDELRVRALKAAANFGYLSQGAEDALLARYVDWRGYPWPERLMAARLMGEVRNAGYRSLLEQMIGDEAYAVRIEAAQAIGRYPQGGTHLARIAGQHPDRYAREAAGEMLERRSYERNVE
ncbi:HEAT repeat domain-containing protein [Paenibacillus cymbidii]|uniref:HEAT repeat domain-containing protein n=1 Tax=Paenibacillus cymbidii TaxID=1639034 RepID=UPI00107FF9FF|nr:HEAT repeat domain-containing protein [Paenibacillus cymbidii]